jgi:hypothetical protein
VLDFARHPLRLGALVATAPEAHRDLGLRGPARLLQAVLDPGHDSPRGVGDVLPAAKGAVEHDDVGIGIQVAKPGRGAGPRAAGRGIVVKGAEEVGGVRTELGEQGPASEGRVLELVDHQMAEAGGDLAPHVGAVGEQPSQGQDHVAGVEAVGGRQDAVMLGIEGGKLALAARRLA